MTSTIVHQKQFLFLCRTIMFCSGAILLISATPPPSVIQDFDEFEFTYRVTLPDISAGGHLWIPLARSDSFQTARIQDISAPITWKQTRDQSHGNQALVFALSPKESGKVVQIGYHVRRFEKTAYPSYDKEDVLQHLRPERLVPTNQNFKSIAEGVIGEKSDVLEPARVLYMHVLEKMRYNKLGQKKACRSFRMLNSQALSKLLRMSITTLAHQRPLTRKSISLAQSNPSPQRFFNQARSNGAANQVQSLSELLDRVP